MADAIRHPALDRAGCDETGGCRLAHYARREGHRLHVLRGIVPSSHFGGPLHAGTERALTTRCRRANLLVGPRRLSAGEVRRTE
eukprot:scaffold75709_cov57-Phaeocystis_antarctica.AAC.1